MNAANERATVTAEMNVTPMLDVLLVLLVIVILAALPINVIDVQLPADREHGVDSDPIVLLVQRNGAYALNGVPLDSLQLPQRLHDVYRGRRAEPLFVQAEVHVNYNAVIHAMDVARGAGVQVLAAMPKQSSAR